MKHRVARPAAATLLCAGCLLAASSGARAETVSCSTQGNVTVCTIDEPTVTQPSKQYPQVGYAPGDTIVVEAGGCVQTGGSGRTWKRYVDPGGPNSDRLYHGLIWLPGATNGMQRIGVNQRSYTVSPTVSPDLTFLRLGYEDDNYGDNGYYSHDDGTGNQCRGVGNAFVRLTITHPPTPPPTPTPAPESTPVPTPSPSPTPKPLDLVTDRFDDNGLPLNPTWWYERDRVLRNVADICGGAPIETCTNQTVSHDSPGLFKSLVPWLCTDTSIDPTTWWAKTGHTNWSSAAFRGNVFWDVHSFDDDYNMALTGFDRFGVPMTLGNGFTAPQTRFNGVTLEYDSDETVDHFASPWWNGFHAAVDRSDDAARQMVDGKEAIVVGLVGLDCVHDCSSEIHPVFALAIRTAIIGANKEQWAIFVRNSGDEGMCSQDRHFLFTPSLTLRFQHPSGTSAFDVTSQRFDTNDATNSLDVAHPAGGDALITFNMPRMSDAQRINGSVEITWR